MKVAPSSSVAMETVTVPGTKGVTMRVLIGERDGAPNFVMRQFELEPGGFTPHHQHAYEHEVFVLEGSGVVLEGETERPIAGGDCVYVAADEVHQFKNTGPAPLRFLCLIPRLNR
jgi:quercetin dioxygenase-like cupin family protein